MPQIAKEYTNESLTDIFVYSLGLPSKITALQDLVYPNEKVKKIKIIQLNRILSPLQEQKYGSIENLSNGIDLKENEQYRIIIRKFNA